MFSDLLGALGASLPSDFDFGGMSGEQLGRSFGDYLDEEFLSDDMPQKHDLNKLRDMTTNSDHMILHIFGTIRIFDANMIASDASQEIGL